MLEVLNLFLPFCSAAARSHLTGPAGRRNRQGFIPDMLAYFDPKRLIEVKGISPPPGPTRCGLTVGKERCKSPGHATNHRAKLIPPRVPRESPED